MSDHYRQKRYLLMTLDPLHVGAGGNRLGRVDMSIVREPGTKLPKIPGTSLHGAIRHYAAVRYDKLACAGSGQGRNGHCKDPQCPICYTFGYLKGQDGGQSGAVNIGDARLLLFPVYSLAGPVWVTCPSVLAEFQAEAADPGDGVGLPQSLQTHVHLNLGWLMLPKTDAPFALPETVPGIPDAIRERAILVSDKLFGQIVNSNLEVRTSVSIDPETGAASDKALFTYEAIPRAALLWLDGVEDDFKGKFQPTDKKYDWDAQAHNAGEALREEWKQPLDVVTAGLKLAAMLGIGGMGTRGFGRVRTEAHWEVK